MNNMIGYIGHASIPQNSANTLQVMKMCQSLSSNAELVLTLPRIMASTAEISSHYGVEAGKLEMVEIFKKGNRRAGRVLYPLLALRLLKRRGVTAVYTRDGYAFLWSILMGFPAYWEVHDDGGSFKSRLWPLIKLALRRHNKWGFVTISSAMRQMLNEGGGIPVGKILVAHDAVDERLLSRYDFDNSAAVRADMGYERDDFIAVYAGKFDKSRGIDDIIYAATILSDINFLLIGATENQLLEYRERCKGIHNVRIMKYLPHSEIPVYLGIANVLLAPYRSETRTIGYCSAVKIPEYMLARKPIVISDFPVFHEVLEPDKDCFFYRPDDKDALVAELKIIKESPEKGMDRANNAYQRAISLTWDNRAHDILDFIATQL